MNKIPKKKIFLIRHGQSKGNIEKTFQDEHDPLTPLGYTQAGKVAERAKELRPDVILSSPMIRALETARAIEKETGAPLEEHAILREYLVPSKLFNTPKSSPESNEYHTELFKNMYDPTWRYEDSENYFDLHNRAMEVIGELKSRKEERILMVSHGAFMSILISTMMSEGIPDPISATRMTRFLRKENTGITIIDYNEKISIANRWRLKVWNDYTHLENIDRTLS